jgi:actin-related protein
MSVTIDLKPEIEKRLEEKAREKGLKVETYIEVLIEEKVNGETEKSQENKKPFYETATPEEWFAELKKWSESHDRNTPFLSDEATGRESIYEDRF